MPLDGITTRALKDELQFIVGSKINKINQPKNLDLVLNLYKKENFKLFLTANSSSPRFCLVEDQDKNPPVPPNFCMILRKHIQGGVIKAISQYKMDRVVKIDISTYNELADKVVKSLIIEIMGRHSNIILINEDGTIIDAIKKVNSRMSRVRQLLPGLKYKVLNDDKIDLLSEDIEPSSIVDRGSNAQFYKIFYKNYTGMSPAIGKEIAYRAGVDPLARTSSLTDVDLERVDQVFKELTLDIREKNYSPCLVYSSQEKRILDFHAFKLSYMDGEIKEYDKLNDAINKYYQSIGKIDSIKTRIGNLSKIITDKKDHLAVKIDDRVRGIKKAEDRDKYKVYADVLSANLYRLEGGEEKISVNNFYSADQETIEIPLDKKKSGPQNVQAFYKRYSKLKNRERLFKIQLPKLEEELKYIEQVEASLENVENDEDLDEIYEELIDAGYIKRKQKNKKKKKKKNKSTPMAFESSQGETIYVGKNNRQNDHLTLKIANKDDIFFHVQRVPGSHVILKVDNDVSDKTLLEAAFLAGYYSSLKGEKMVTVDYTEKKNVYKAKGAKPGMVYYNDFDSIIVDLKDKDLVEILNRRKNN